MTEMEANSEQNKEGLAFYDYLRQLPLAVMVVEKQNDDDVVVFLNEYFKRHLPGAGVGIPGRLLSKAFGLSAGQAQEENRVLLHLPVAYDGIQAIRFHLTPSAAGGKHYEIWTQTDLVNVEQTNAYITKLGGSFKDIFTESEEIVLCTNREGKILFFNEAFIRLTGRETAQIQEADVHQHFSGINEEEIEEVYSAVWQGIPQETMISVKARNGSEHWFQCTLTPVRESGEIIAVYLIGREATMQQLRARYELLLNEISAVFRQEIELKPALEQVLKRLCEKFGWEAGEFWLPDPLNRRIKLFSWNYPSEIAFNELLDVSLSEQISAEIEQSVTTASGRPLLHKSSHLFLNDNFPRKSYVNKAGMNQGFSVPVYSGDQITAIITFFASGNIRGFSKDLLFFCRELAQRIGVYIQLHRLRHDYRQMFELVPDFLVVLNANGRIFKLNRYMQDVLGIKDEEMRSHSLISFIPDEYQEEIISRIQEVKSKENVSFEAALKGAEQELLIEWSLSYNRDEQVIYGAGKDITLRIKYDQEFRKNNERIHILSEAISDAIYEWDIRDNKIVWGDGFKRNFGHQDEHLYNHIEGWSSFIAEPDRARVSSNLDLCIMKKQRTWTDEYRYRCADGTYKSILDRGVFIYNEKGDVVRMVGVMQDITALKESEETLIKLNDALQMRARQLQGFNKELEQFAYIVSHDLQEPLRMISSFMQLLKTSDDIEKNEKSEQYIDFAIDGALRMKRLIQDLLTYSRVGTTEEDFQDVDLNRVIHDTIMVYQQQIRDKNAHLEIGDLPRVRAIYSLMGQLFDNLLSNALKYNRNPSPQISIDADQNETHYIISFSDNGIGIDPRHFDMIYLPFKRLHNKNEYSGTGIGLAVCKKIVEKHQGQIWVESTPGMGSRFYFSILK